MSSASETPAEEQDCRNSGTYLSRLAGRGLVMSYSSLLLPLEEDSSRKDMVTPDL